MGTGPTKAADNMFCKCRLAAAKYNDKLSSREGAAELLGISVSTLASYELNLTKVVPAESIILMADAYNAPELKRWYCNNVCPLGEDLPPVELAELESLLDIASDGVISEDEETKLQQIIETLKEVSAVAQSLILWAEKNAKKEVMRK